MPTQDPISVWRRPERAPVGPKPEHSRERIVSVAVTLADGEGLSAVSIRRVATTIGAGAASLYRYLKSHDELVELMIDSVSGEYDLALSTQPAHDQLLSLARQAREIMHRHVWLAPLLLTRPSMGPHTLAYLERALTALEPTGLETSEKLQTVAMLSAITSAFVQNELTSSSVPGATQIMVDATARGEYFSAIIQSRKYPQLSAALGEQHEPTNSDDLFARIISTYLVGAGVPKP